MELSTVALLMTTAWLGVLTLVTLLLIRQLGLVTVRLDRDRGASAAINDGLKVGEPVPAAMAHLTDVDRHGVGYILVLGAVCAPCRELASDLAGVDISSPITALVSGSGDENRSIEHLLPSTVKLVRDTPDGDLANTLRIETTPFVFEVANNIVRGKAVLRGAAHLASFIDGGNDAVHGAPPQIEEVAGA